MYIHIPFCEYICHYCDFVKRVPKDSKTIDQYLIHLVNEIKSYEMHFNSIDTIYIGGGTPSMLSVDQLELLLSSLSNVKPVEFTIEVNPDSYTYEKGLIFKKYGINRVSLGVQTFDADLLKFINRKHTNQMVYDTVKHLKEIGLNNISIDLIYAIPGQTMEMLEIDLNEIIKLDINHISCYSLILENNTYFYHQYKYGNFKPVDNDLEGQMFEKTIDFFVSKGFDHYEISNFAKGSNNYSKHNLLYWQLEDYLGVGLGAHGFYNNYRTYNHKAFPKYYTNPLATKVLQEKSDLMADYMIFGLRKIAGINIGDFNNRFETNLFTTYPEIQSKINDGLLEIKHNNLRLTKKGIFLGNQVFEVFV